MSNKMRIEIERQVAKRAIAALLAAGYELAVHDGEEVCLRRCKDPKKIIGAMFSTDEDTLLVYKGKEKEGWVQFIYGNDGWDVISDYNTCFETVLEPVMEWARAETLDFPPDLEMVRELVGAAEERIFAELDKLENSGASVAELRALLSELLVKVTGENMIEEGAREMKTKTHGNKTLDDFMARQEKAWEESPEGLRAKAERVARQQNQLVDCRWFARCDRKATGTTPHPVLGEVPTCDRCAEFANGGAK